MHRVLGLIALQLGSALLSAGDAVLADRASHVGEAPDKGEAAARPIMTSQCGQTRTQVDELPTCDERNNTELRECDSVLIQQMRRSSSPVVRLRAEAEIIDYRSNVGCD